jgi:hypothetical protein
MSAGLAASTVTPGSAAPDGSVTTPAIPLAAVCAKAAVAPTTIHVMVATITAAILLQRIDVPASAVISKLAL